MILTISILHQALIHGLNRHYYSIAINYRKNELEEKMLLNLHKKKWTDGLILKRFDTHSKTNEQTVQVPMPLSSLYLSAEMIFFCVDPLILESNMCFFCPLLTICLFLSRKC